MYDNTAYPRRKLKCEYNSRNKQIQGKSMFEMWLTRYLHGYYLQGTMHVYKAFARYLHGIYMIFTWCLQGIYKVSLALK